MDRRSRAVAALGVAFRQGLLCAAALWLLHGLFPAALPAALALSGAWIALAAGLAFATGGLPPLGADRLLGLADQLATWEESADRATPWREWLGVELRRAIAALPPERRRRALVPRLGPWRYALPILIVLWLLELSAPLPWRGLGPRAGGGAPQAGSGATQARGERPATRPRPERPEPEQPESRPEPPASEPARKPLLDLRAEDAFTVPAFVADGPTRKALVPIALADQESGGSAGGAGGGAGAAIDPRQVQGEYQTRLEQAMRKRRVPEAERPIVRRYFERLAEDKR